MMLPNDLIFRLRKRAEIRRQITTRKSVQNNEPDRIADLLEEAASEIEALQEEVKKYEKHIAVRYLEELRDEQ
jgi:phage host-nuclease inhibitor protein Gam